MANRSYSSYNRTDAEIDDDYKQSFLFTYIDYKKINGTISLYRPSNQKLDFETKISLSSPIMLIPNHKLVGGLWEISIHWKVGELTYLNKETVYF